MLSKREQEILHLQAVGFTPDEIGDVLFISPETVRKTICNIKLKKNLHKSTELVAEYWCQAMGSSLGEQRAKILEAYKRSTVTLLAFGILMNVLSTEMIRPRRVSFARRQEMEWAVPIEA